MTKKIDKAATAQSIIDKCLSSNGYSIDIDKFNRKSKSEKFLKEAAAFCRVPVVYTESDDKVKDIITKVAVAEDDGPKTFSDPYYGSFTAMH